MVEMQKKELGTMIQRYMKRDIGGKRDLCLLYQQPGVLRSLISQLADPFRGKVDYVASPESLGFILGSMLAEELGVGFLPIRNSSLYRLREEDILKASYIDHRDCTRSLHIRRDNLPAGSRVLLADDWIETAATIQACATIIEEADCTVTGIASIGAKATANTRKMLESKTLVSILME